MQRKNSTECVKEEVKYTFWIDVMNGSFPTNLLGCKPAVEMGLVCRVKGLELFQEVFGDIVLLNCPPVKIELQPDVTPYSIATPRHIL